MGEHPQPVSLGLEWDESGFAGSMSSAEAAQLESPCGGCKRVRSYSGSRGLETCICSPSWERGLLHAEMVLEDPGARAVWRARAEET